MDSADDIHVGYESVPEPSLDALVTEGWRYHEDVPDFHILSPAQLAELLSLIRLLAGSDHDYYLGPPKGGLWGTKSLLLRAKTGYRPEFHN